MASRRWPGIAAGLLGTIGAHQLQAQSLSIPLKYTPIVVTAPNITYRLGIFVGINGGPAQQYLFDTGSNLFNAAYNPATWNGFSTGQMANGVPVTSTLAQNYLYSYGTSYSGNIVQVQALSFFQPGAATPTSTLPVAPGAPGYVIGAVYQNTGANGNPTFPGWFLDNPNQAPIEGNFFGTFGAATYATTIPSQPSGSGPSTPIGGVLGQAILPNVAAQGYVVSANGQGNMTNPTLGLANPPSGTASVTIGGQFVPVSACNPCVTLGLTPAILGQFLPVGPPSANPALAGAMPLVSGGNTFPNPNGGGAGNPAATQLGAMTLSTLNGVPVTRPTLFDTGTGDFGINGLVTPGVLTVVGTNQQGQVVAGLPVSTSTVTTGASPTTYNMSTGYANAVMGIGFFMQNSVMFDLTDGLMSYTPYFVTADPLTTTATGNLIVVSANLPLGLAGSITGPGGVVVLGGGNVQLSAVSTYTGATTIAPGGRLLVSGIASIWPSSGVANDGILDISRAWAPVWLQTLTGAGQVDLGGQGLVLTNASGTFSGTMADGGSWGATGGSLTVAGGTLTFAGAGTYTGGTLVGGGASLVLSGSLQGTVYNAGSFANNGAVQGSVSNIGVLSGSGLIAGNLANAGLVAPGNGNASGTLSVGGNFSNGSRGVLGVAVGAAGQGTRLNVGGTATLQGGAVSVTAQPGTSFAPRTTWTILNAAGGLAGTFASVNEPYPFLLSSLSYDASNAYLTLDVGGFASAAATPIQAAVGAVLDANVNTATGDFAQVLGAMATGITSNAGAQAVLQQLSGNNYAGFSTSMVQGAQLFMGNFAGYGGASASGAGATASNPAGGGRVALAEACDVACDPNAPPLWGAWGGALGGLGRIGASQAVGGVTYNAGGFAVGLDRLITQSTRLGVTAGYTTGTQWVSGFSGQGRTDTFQAGLYGGWAEGPAYADALLGYAYSANQMWRQITIPGLAPRTAQGQTGANQWYGQLETGYRFDVGPRSDAGPNAFVTPFARLQAYTGTQDAFTETGAQSLDLSVAKQTTSSLRSVIGAQLGGSMDLGWREKLAVQFRLGWSHDYASTARPVTATLAGAPAMPFTTWGVAPQRDGVVLGVSANTAIAEGTSLYVRYEGNVAGQDSAHAITAGVRMTW